MLSLIALQIIIRNISPGSTPPTCTTWDMWVATYGCLMFIVQCACSALTRDGFQTASGHTLLIRSCIQTSGWKLYMNVGRWRWYDFSSIQSSIHNICRSPPPLSSIRPTKHITHLSLEMNKCTLNWFITCTELVLLTPTPTLNHLRLHFLSVSYVCLLPSSKIVKCKCNTYAWNIVGPTAARAVNFCPCGREHKNHWAINCVSCALKAFLHT